MGRLSLVKAWVVREIGSAPQMALEDIDEPPAADGMVRIQVEAAAVNFFDSLQLAGLYQVKPDLPFTPGAEVSGIVLEVTGGRAI